MAEKDLRPAHVIVAVGGRFAPPSAGKATRAARRSRSILCQVSWRKSMPSRYAQGGQKRRMQSNVVGSKFCDSLYAVCKPKNVSGGRKGERNILQRVV